MCLCEVTLAHKACLPCRQMTFLQGKKVKRSDYYNLVLLCDKVTPDASPSQRNSQPAIRAAMKIHPEVEF